MLNFKWDFLLYSKKKKDKDPKTILILAEGEFLSNSIVRIRSMEKKSWTSDPAKGAND